MLEINTSKIKNTVTFAVDKEALRAAKQAIKSVNDFAEGLQPSLNMAKFKRQMREMEQYARRVNHQVNNVPGAGTAPTGGQRPPRGSGSSRTSPEEKEQKRAQRRDELGRLRMENFSYQAGKFTRADTNTLNTARSILSETVELYQKEEVSLARLNQVLAHQLDIIRRSHREKTAEIEDTVRGRRREKRELEEIAKLNRRIAQREEKDRAREAQRSADRARRAKEHKYGQISEGLLGLSPRLLGAGLLGAAAYEGASRTGELLNSTAERNNLVIRGAQNVQTNPNAILTMRTWGEENGVDSANIIKAIDNIKDVRERLGDSVLSSEFKDGKWKGGDAGINDIMNQFGWNKDDIAKFQNRPLDFIQATVNEGQRRGMNSAQIGRLIENLGDDLMHYQRMFSNNGEEYRKTLQKLIDTGAALNNEQIQATLDYKAMSIQLGLITEGMSNNFLTGFMQAFGDSAQEISNNAKALGESAKWAGEQVGDFARQLSQLITSIVEWKNNITRWFNPSPQNKETVKNAFDVASPYRIYTNPNAPWDHTDPKAVTSAADSSNLLWNWISGFPERFDAANQAVLNMFNTSPTGKGKAYTPNVPLQVTINQPPAQVNILPDASGFSNWLRAEMDMSFGDYNRSFTLQMNAAQSSNGAF